LIKGDRIKFFLTRQCLLSVLPQGAFAKGRDQYRGLLQIDLPDFEQP
jgi:hypothetical protein